MATYSSDTLGYTDDEVTITLGGAGTTRVVESYEVKHALLEQPCAFALVTGTSDTAASLLKLARPRTPFTLSVGGVLQQTGWVDGPEASDGTNGCSVPIHGRDALAEVHDASVEADRSLAGLSLADLTAEVLKVTVSRPDWDLTYSNALNRRHVTGGQAGASTVPEDIGAALTRKGAKELTAKAGERWYDVLKKELDRAGVFLIARADGNFALLAPHTSQVPTYRIVREAGGAFPRSSAITARYKNVATTRYSTYRVIGRKGGGAPSTQAHDAPDAPEDIQPALIGGLGSAGGRKKFDGLFEDQEMIAWGYKKPLVIVDSHAKSLKEAEFLARKKCAESRRANWQLSYTVPGHTWPAIRGGGRAVWAYDTMVEVVDQRLGIEGAFYIEAVTFRRGPDGTTTELALMRPEDVVFGDPTA